MHTDHAHRLRRRWQIVAALVVALAVPSGPALAAPAQDPVSSRADRATAERWMAKARYYASVEPAAVAVPEERTVVREADDPLPLLLAGFAVLVSLTAGLAVVRTRSRLDRVVGHA